jgi:hypothetical protein
MSRLPVPLTISKILEPQPLAFFLTSDDEQASIAEASRSYLQIFQYSSVLHAQRSHWELKPQAVWV